MSNNDKDFEVCLRAENVVLPKNGYFGISAATGGLADDHDVLKFNVFSLRSPEEAVKDVHDPEAEKFDQEFNQYQDKLKQQKEQWAKENPEEVYKLKCVICFSNLLYFTVLENLKKSRPKNS